MAIAPPPIRKKNKELTKDEAIAQAKEDLAQYWFGCDPLFATVTTPQGVSLFPLSERFQKKYWLVSYFDPTNYSGEVTVNYVAEFYRRFQGLQVQFLSILAASYGFAKERAIVEKYVKQVGISGFVTMDYDNSLAELFAVKEVPKFIFFQNGQIVSALEGPYAPITIEAEIHKKLRHADPGLPLEPFYRPMTLPSNWVNIEMGRLNKPNYVKPIFIGGKFSHLKERVTSGTFAAKNESVIELGALALTGAWHQNDECIFTSDSNASLRFTSYGSSFSFLARSLTPGADFSRIAISLKGNVIHDMFFSKEIFVDDEWGPMVRVKIPRLYYGLTKLPINMREFTLHFPLAHQAAIALFGIQFCD